MSRKQRNNLIRILLSAACFLAGLLIRSAHVRFLLLLTAYLIVGFDVLHEALGGIVRGQIFDENFLMGIATIGALIIGEYHEAAAVMLFYQIGEFFQHYAIGKSRASISELMELRPEQAMVEREGALVELDPEEVAVGEVFVVRAGERIALDGVVLEGVSVLDTSALTGESLPREVVPGDEVISGCINQTGLLRIRSSKAYCDSTVARILDMVENASDKKARVESFITRFARIYTPAVCTAALLLFLLPVLFWNGAWKEWGYRALSFLVVSCPCALVISVPLSFFGGIGGASRCGILMKGSSDLEALARASVLVLDKTGTLTKGTFRISQLLPETMNEDEFLHLAALVESVSAHPLSRSICEAYEGELETEELTGIVEKAGYGVSVVWRDHVYFAGNARWMERNDIAIPAQSVSGTVVYIGCEKTFLGWITFADEVKEGAAEALLAMRKCGINRMMMLTGDSEAAAQQVAAECGIDEVYAQLLPDGKVTQIERLIAARPRNASVVFAGDGINDAPVLMRADVGVAMGAFGSDAAIEAADVVLMDDDLHKLSLAIQISRRTVSIARQNIVFALMVKLMVLVLVAFGAAGMWLAVFADVGVSVLAILNAMRTLKIQKK